ncbi:MAG: PAS domain-containing protein [Veillonellaceae bacterium]|nr:PAS domain-containing protein [Veillonellaceae bacterium]
MAMVEKNKSRFELEKMLEGYPALKQILCNMKQVVWLLDLNTDEFVYVSPAFEIVWGRSCESFYADPLTLIKSVHPEDRVQVMSASPDDGHKSMTQTYRILRPDGSLRWISAHTFLIESGSRETSYQVCIAQDITVLNQVDETLRKALDRSREQFTLSRRMSLARKPEAVLKTLMSSSELRFARRAFVLFFESPSVSPSPSAEVISSWPSATNATTRNPNKAVNETSLIEELVLLNIFHPSRPIIIPQISKDERLSAVVRKLLLEEQIQSMAIFPLVALGNWLGCLLVFYSQKTHFLPIELQHIKVLVDQAAITLYNLQLLEIEAESRQEAERANEIKTKFLAMISHELRTPLTSIKGFTTTLLAEDVIWEPEEQRDFVQTIQQEANRLQELIDHLLDLSRLEAGMLPISLEPHSLQDVIEDALPQFQTLTNEQILTIHVPATLPLVYVDAKRIAQVLVNLVRNAAFYSNKGTEINISAHLRKDFVQINVIDQGPGIPPAEHKRVFRAFQRGKSVENSSVQGAGLGLAICKGLVEAHGGHIWVKKKSTPGATISFTIPLVPLHIPANTVVVEK